MNRYFPYIVLSASLALAVTAAYYSVFGLSKLFSAQATAVIVMASILEGSKLVTASYLHRKWKVTHWFSKTYLTLALIVLMLITSLGIYGFLVSAYQETAYAMKNVDQQTAVIQLKKDRWSTQIQNIQLEKESLNKSISDLTAGLANNVITYTDANGNVIRTTSSSTRRSLERQLEQNTERRDELYSKEVALTDSVTNCDMQILDLQTNSDAAAELGPIKYVAELSGKSTDNIVNKFILLFIFVFDPLAVMLLIAANQLLTKDNSNSFSIEPEPEPIVVENEVVHEEVQEETDIADQNDVQKVYQEFLNDPQRTDSIHNPTPTPTPPTTIQQPAPPKPGLHNLWRTAARKKSK